MSSYEKQSEIANMVCKNIAEQMSMANHAFPESHQRLTFVMSVALVPLVNTMQAVCKYDNFDELAANPDHVLLASLVLANSIAFAHEAPTHHRAAFGVEFDLTNIANAMHQFNVLTGREAKIFMNESLVTAVEENAKDAISTVPSKFNKFLPQ